MGQSRSGGVGWRVPEIDGQLVAKRDMGEMPAVWVIVLNWNNAPDTVACLESVSRSDYPNYQVLLVDNGSSDDSVRVIQETYPGITVVQLPENLGYAEGNNRGIRCALDLEADYVLILNNDTVVAADMLDHLVAVAETDPRIGILGPTVYDLEVRDRLCAAGSIILWATGTTRHRGVLQTARDCQLPLSPEPADFLVGTGLLLSRACVQAIGCFDPQYYLNFEDVELSTRAWRNGYAVAYVPRAAMWHKVSATLGQASPANTYYMTRNALRFFWLCAPHCLRGVAVSWLVLRTVRTTGAWTLRPRYRTDWFRRKRDANLLALRDFFLGRFGRMGGDVARVCYGGT
jgi:GT2 family glycosyltransferase